MLKFLDLLFIFFHTLLIVFNLFGWIWKFTRKANLITLLLTGGSWFILGIFYGIGYCPLTDWHFDILEKLGVQNIPNSYTKYLFDRLLNLNLSPKLVDTATGIAYFSALIISIFVNLKDRWFRKRQA